MKKKGFSLIEVIVAVVIISIVVTGFMSITNGNFKMLIEAKKDTQTIYEAQTNLLESQKNARKNLALGHIMATKTISKPFNFNTSIDVYQLEAQVDGKSVATWICPDQKLNYVKPSVGDVKLTVYRRPLPCGYKPVAKLPYLTDPSQLTLEAELTGETGTYYEYNWYWAEKEDVYKYNIPIYDTDNINPEEWGTRYPVFPGSYTRINIAKSIKSLPLSDFYAGKHIIVTAQPFDASGNGGDIMISNSVFFPGLLETDKLLAHIDASVIDYHDNDYAYIMLPRVLRKWIDLANGAVDVENGPTSAVFPGLEQTKLSDRVKAQSIFFSSGSYIKVTDPATVGRRKTFIFVTRNSRGDQLVQNGTKKIVDNVSGNSGKIEIFVKRMETQEAVTLIGKGNYSLYELLIYDGFVPHDKLIRIFQYLALKYNVTMTI